MTEKLVASTQSEKLLPQNEVIQFQEGKITIIPIGRKVNNRVEGYHSAIISEQAIPLSMADFFNENTSLLEKLIWGEPLEKGKERQAFPLDATYNEVGEWIIRWEEIVSFATVRNGKIEYISRRRPALENSNTPGEMDPGVLSHGGISQAGIVNAWRYVADKLGKNDNQLTEEEYISYLENNPFPQWTIFSLGKFILTNGHVGREGTHPTSGLMNARVIIVSPSEFDALIAKNNAESTSIEYTKVVIGESTDDFTPKHMAFNALIGQNAKEIINFWNRVWNTVSKWKSAVEEIIKS